MGNKVNQSIIMRIFYANLTAFSAKHIGSENFRREKVILGKKHYCLYKTYTVHHFTYLQKYPRMKKKENNWMNLNFKSGLEKNSLDHHNCVMRMCIAGKQVQTAHLYPKLLWNNKIILRLVNISEIAYQFSKINHFFHKHTTFFRVNSIFEIFSTFFSDSCLCTTSVGRLCIRQNFKDQPRSIEKKKHSQLVDIPLFFYNCCAFSFINRFLRK